MGLLEAYNTYVVEKIDPRVADWFGMGLAHISILLFCYIYFVFQCGPRFMKDRPAYKLKTFIRFYNVFQIFANFYIVREILKIYPDGTALRCVPIDYSMDPSALRLAELCYYITLIKAVDLIETPLFVLRKKPNQITFLHLYHHITTVTIAWASIRHIAGGMAMFYPVLNCSIHVVMYTYYLLSNIEGVKELIVPLKRYITIMQMVQFVILIFHAAVAMTPSCDAPTWPAFFIIVNVFINLNFFYKFYKQAYLQPKKKNA